MSWLFQIPLWRCIIHTFAPEHPFKLILPIITLVGGTVGVILLLQVHRILDSGIKVSHTFLS